MFVTQLKQALRRIPRARILLSSLRPAATLTLGLYRTLQWPHLRFPVLRYPKRRKAIYLLGLMPPATPPMIYAPSVVGLTQAAGASAFTALGLLVQVQTLYNPDVLSGIITAQSITAGVVVLVGETVTLTVSLGPQPPPPPFRVQAVTAGEYNGTYYVPGDVFDLLAAADYSDSTVNYESAGGDTRYGWMVKVPQTTPLYQWQQTNLAPAFPALDPTRSFIN